MLMCFCCFFFPDHGHISCNSYIAFRVMVISYNFGHIYSEQGIANETLIARF